MGNIKIEQQIGGKIIHLKGQFIGGKETDELRKTLNEFSQQNESKLVIDLAGVTYLNSAALGVLIAANSNFLKRKARIVLCNLDKNIENIFIITKLSLVFEIAEDIDSAIKKLSD